MTPPDGCSSRRPESVVERLLLAIIEKMTVAEALRLRTFLESKPTNAQLVSYLEANGHIPFGLGRVQ